MKKGIEMIVVWMCAALFLAGCSGADKKTENSISAKKGEVSIVFDGDKVSLSSGGGATADGTQVKISSTGVYRISGTSDDANIVVDTKKTGVVELILDGLTLGCKNSSPIYIKDAPEALITLEKGSVNILSDGKTYKGQSQDEPDACIFSKDDLRIEGEGSLEVQGNFQGGIHGKDKLSLQAADVKVNAVEDGITGKDGLTVEVDKLDIEAKEKGMVTSGTLLFSKGTAAIKTDDDCLHSNDSLQIDGGQLTLESGDDGIHADGTLTVNGGEIVVEKSDEGMEATAIEIGEAAVTINASDDGVNASNGTDTSDNDDMFDIDDACKVTIKGGTVLINADGDGIDSNGNIEITGGSITVTGSANDGNSALDYNGTCLVSDATLIAAGCSGMAQSVSEDSVQCGICMTFSDKQKKDSVISIVDADGKEIISYTVQKDMDAIVFSAPDLQKNESYAIHVDGKEIVKAKITKTSTWLNEDGETEANSGFRGGHGGRKTDGTFKKGEKPNGDAPTGQKPDGTPPALPDGTAPGGDTAFTSDRDDDGDDRFTSDRDDDGDDRFTSTRDDDGDDRYTSDRD